MTYQPLARKYRPSLFAELVGQESVAQALANAIAMGREPHGVIFTGVRGVGKTTVARLYAKALNCEDRRQTATGIEPCNSCESCLAVARGNHEDVLEIDGASNTGVADVRALQETVGYLPQRSNFKVYIIDEVHMLSQAAFNALLKTLEEPPAHVVFIFATTEMHKVPQTIMSRCQTFYLRKLPTPLILGRLQLILKEEGLSSEEAALGIVAREGHGSMRDALTLLDQAIALGQGRVTKASLGWLVSNLSSSPYLELLSALCARDAKRALSVVEGLDQSGADFADVTEATAQLARHAFVLQGLGPKALDQALLGLDDGEISSLTALAASAAPFDLNRIFRTLVQCRSELEGSGLDRCILENYLFEWCLDPGLPDIDQLLNGARPQPTAAASMPRAESANVGDPRAAAPRAPSAPSAAQKPAAAAATARPPQPQAQSVAVPTASEPPPREAPRALAKGQWPATWRQLVDAWKQQKPLQARKLEEVHPLEYSPQRIILAIPEDSYASKSLLQRDEQQRVREQFRELFGFAGTLIVQGMDKSPSTAPTPAVVPETILSERGREADDRRTRLVEEAKNAPFTRDLLSALGGQLEGVRIPDSEQP